MGLLDKLFGKKEDPIQSYADFWEWFQKNEKQFHDSVKNQRNIGKDFLDKIGPKLEQIKDGFYYLTGMYDENTVELVITADGNIRNIAFVEELIAASPLLNGWKFTALKPSNEIDNVTITMGEYEFSENNLNFYADEKPDYPDEIDITIVHSNFKEEDRLTVTNGTYIYLDNYLGELDFVNNIDNVKVIAPSDAEKELIPIGKLKDYLIWRQKEFIEKYHAASYNTEDDEHSILEATLQSGSPLVAVINTDILKWVSKASHPWVTTLTIKYDGSNNNGLPNPDDHERLGQIEEELLAELNETNGHLFIGHQSAKNDRDVYLVSKDFRMVSKTLYAFQQRYAQNYEMEFEIYKDKYWQSFEAFNQ